MLNLPLILDHDDYCTKIKNLSETLNILFLNFIMVKHFFPIFQQQCAFSNYETFKPRLPKFFTGCSHLITEFNVNRLNIAKNFS